MDLAILLVMTVSVGGSALAIAQYNAKKKAAMAAREEELRKRAEQEKKEEQGRHDAVLKWAEGDSSYREAAISVLTDGRVPNTLITVMDRFVSNPTKFECSTVTNKEMDLSCRQAYEKGVPGSNTVSLFFGANRSQSITHKRLEKSSDVSVGEGRVVLRVASFPKEGQGTILVVDDTGKTSYTVAGWLHEAANISFGRSVMYGTTSSPVDDLE